MTSKLASCLLSKLSEPQATALNKVTIVGCGDVGIACAVTLLTQRVTHNICLLDVDEAKVQGEISDLLHGSKFLEYPTIVGGRDVALSINSRLIIVTAGVRQKEGEPRLELAQRNADLMKAIIPDLVKFSPNAILLIVTNPVDVMTFVAWKISGLPRHKVIGSGTNLDSSRFRFLLSQKLGVSPKSVHGWIIGEHGDQSVAIWSGINVGSVNLKDINPDIGQNNDPEKFGKIHEQVVSAAYEVIKLKGYTNWAIGLSCSDIVKKIFSNSNAVLPLSVLAEGQQGIDVEVYLSLPCVVNASGVTHIVKTMLTVEEKGKLKKSAASIFKVQSELKL
ncbi:LDHB family protein [Megaselia abdita]